MKYTKAQLLAIPTLIGVDNGSQLKIQTENRRVWYQPVTNTVTEEVFIDGKSIDVLSEYEAPDTYPGDVLQDEINITWCIDDVKDLDDSLTDDECRKVLARVEKDHDATLGVNWDTLQVYIDEVKDVPSE